MSLGDFLGFSWRPRERGASTRLEDVTNVQVWQDLSQLSLRVPSPPSLSPTLSPWQALDVLITCYAQSIDSLPNVKHKGSATVHVIKGMLAKDPKKGEAAKGFIDACQQLAREGSPISPLVWTWWRIQGLVARGWSPYCLKVVWSRRVLEKKLRRFFYEETSYSALSGKPVWPMAASQLYGLWRKLEADVRTMDHLTASAHWASWEPSYHKLVARGLEQRAVIQRKMDKHVAKWDLQLWLTPDLLAYLNVGNRAEALTPRAPKRRTAR